MTKRKTMIGGGIILLLAAAAWAFGLFGGADPAVAKLNDLRGQMGDKNLSDAQRSALRGEFRQQVQSLTDDQRRAFFQAGRGEWQARQQQRMDEFFAMSKADQQKRLDEILNRMLDAQKNAQAGAQSGQGQNGGQGQNAGGKNGAGRGNRAGMTDEQREERSKRRIENSDPKSRAQMAQFRKALDNRAAQRGLPAPGAGGGGFGRRGA
jgi:hypothetical protein